MESAPAGLLVALLVDFDALPLVLGPLVLGPVDLGAVDLGAVDLAGVTGRPTSRAPNAAGHVH